MARTASRPPIHRPSRCRIRPSKPENGTANTDDKPAQQDKAASEAGTTDTESSKHAGKASPQAEHRAAAPAPQVLTDPALQPPTGIQPHQIQTHAANLTAVPIPATNAALADSAPVPLNGLAADIALRAAGGNSRFEIRLDPAELGRIDVRLDVDKHGNVTSHLTVERPATLDMLRRDAPQLQQALEDAGLKTGDSGLQFSLRDQSSSGRDSDNGSGRNSQRVVITEEDTIPAQVAGRTYGRMLGASSGVDIRI
jgi:flagellar hook-length control protein FliK